MKKKNAVRIILNTIIVILAIIAVFLCSIRILGYTPYIITSDSMEPTYSVNDMVYTKEANFSDLKEGDVITFVNTNDSVVTHRIIEVDEGERCVYTQGDSNEFPDVMPVYEEDIIGIVHFALPKIGIFSIKF